MAGLVRHRVEAQGEGAWLTIHDWRRAFSLRTNWRSLTTAAPGTLPIVDGIRALSILWVFAFHVVWFLCFFLPPEAARRVASDPALRLFWCGDLGVDAFFTISGYLIVDLLMEEHDATRRIAVSRFYLRRAMRTIPAYLCVLGLYCGLGLPECAWAWTNLLHVNNFVPVEDQCMPWSWSLAVEEQFYAVIPFLLLLLYRFAPAYRARWIAGLLGLSLVISFYLVITHGFGLPLPALASVDQDRSSVAHFFDTLYDKPHARCGPLIIGMLVAVLRRRPSLVERLAKHQRVAGVGLAAALATIALVCLYPSRDPDLAQVPRWFSVVYIATFRQAFSVGLACVLLLGSTTHPAGRAVAGFLSHRGWYPIAQLSYSIYLLHPICIITLFTLVPPGAAPSRGAILAYGIVALALSLAGALALYLLVERPFIRLRPPRRPLPASGEGAFAG